MRNDPDPELIRRAQEGDRTSLRALLEEIGPAVRRWSLAATGDPEKASDLCQEVYVLLLRKLPSFRGQARFLTWLFSVTRNQALESLRRKKRHERKMIRFKQYLGDPYASNPGADRVDRDRIGSVVRGFVKDLPARQREVFLLADLEGLSSPEIGEILDLKPVSVRAALLKARRTLRRKLLEHHPEFSEEYLT